MLCAKRSREGDGRPGVDFTITGTRVTGGLAAKGASEDKEQSRHRAGQARAGQARTEGPEVGGAAVFKK